MAPINFKTLEEIISHFQLSSKESEEVKKDLKNLLKTVHPDKNEGRFNSPEDEVLYHEIQRALKLLQDKMSDAPLVANNDITALATALKDLVKSKKEENASETISKSTSQLSNKLEESIESFHRQLITPKITGIIATAIITTLWTFPSIAKQHPLLSILYQHNIEFTAIWIFSLLLSAFLWLVITIAETKDKKIKENYRLESTQNYIFSLFLQWRFALYQGIEVKTDKIFYRFCKDDLTLFLDTRFEELEKFVHKKDKNDKLAERELIRRYEEWGYKRSLRWSVWKFFPTPGEITPEIAHFIADMIINRLVTKEVITKSNEKKLSDFYQYETEL